MTTRLLSLITMGCLVFALSGCSSSQTSDSPPDDSSDTAAGTDTVPTESGDQPADGNVASADTPPPPADANAPAPDSKGSTPPDASSPTKAPEDLPLAPPPADAATAPTANAAPAPSSPELAQNSVPAPAPDPAPPAAAESAPTLTAAPDNSDNGSYTVRRGDTLMRIAFETCGDLYKWKDIYEANRDQIKNPNLILPGAVLKVPHGDGMVAHNGEKHVIKPGETLGSISKNVYGTPNKWKALWANNRDLIKDPNRIFAGFFIYYTASPSDEDIKNAPAPLADQPTSAPDTRAPASVKSAAPAQPAPMMMTPVAPGHQ
jgi:nucleoid-associated protein YgaU